MKLAISEVLPNLLDDAKHDGTFNVIYLVEKLLELKKINWETLDVWNHMERSGGPIIGEIKNFEFHYSYIELDKGIHDDDLEGNVLNKIHYQINKELRLIRGFFIG